MKNQTYIQQQQAFIDAHQQQVKELLQWNDQTYAHFIYNSGHQYLAAYFGNDQDAIDLLQKRTEFWNWWKSLWNTRDQVFAESVTDTMTLENRLKLYHTYHDAKSLVCEIGPPAVVLGTAFEKINIVQI